MARTIVSEGKTTQEAIDKGLKELQARKDQVDIKVLEQEDKKSFFSILAPRIVKVEITLKEGIKTKEKEEHNKEEKRKSSLSKEQIEQIEQRIASFLKEFVKKLPTKETNYEISHDEERINVKLTGDNLSYLIGYRGDTLNSLQIILSAIANREIEDRVKVLVDIGDYREKRVKTLEELAEKISKTVIRTGKKVTLEPMTAYERKIIHSKLQENNKIKTYSIGEEPNRKIVVALNK